MNDTPTIRVEMQGSLAVVNLAQPQRGNPIDGDFSRDVRRVALDLWDLCDRRVAAGADPQAAGGGESGSDSTLGGARLRAVLLRADGANFSVGGDLKKFLPERANLAPLVRAWTADLHMGLQRIWELPVPIVCAVQGFAMGGGVSLAAGCDVVLAGASARFGSAFAHLGFSCDCGSSTTLTARMGPARARRFVLLGEMLDGAAALEAGLVDRVVTDEQVQEEALKLALALAQGPTLAYGEIKRLFLRAGAALLQSQLEDEAFTLARMSATADAQEGIAAMVERRKPRFHGR